LKINLTGLISYDHNYGGKHTINLLAGVTKETSEGDNYFAFRRYFISPVVDQLLAGGSLEQNVGNNTSGTAMVGTPGPFKLFWKGRL
jgi:hypothetical protein